MHRFLLTALLTLPLPAANLIQNPGFEDSTFSQPFLIFSSSIDAPGWDWGGPGLALMLHDDYTEGAWLFPAHSGQNSLDLTGPVWTGANLIRQDVSTVVGQSYRLTFWLGNQDDNLPPYTQPSQIQVEIDDSPVAIFSLSGSGTNAVNWAQHTWDFTAASTSTRIGFRNQTSSDDHYTGLDDVSLEAIAETPEPSTMLPLLTLAALGVAKRRRSARIIR